MNRRVHIGINAVVVLAFLAQVGLQIVVNVVDDAARIHILHGLLVKAIRGELPLENKGGVFHPSILCFLDNLLNLLMSFRLLLDFFVRSFRFFGLIG